MKEYGDVGANLRLEVKYDMMHREENVSVRET